MGSLNSQDRFNRFHFLSKNKSLQIKWNFFTSIRSYCTCIGANKADTCHSQEKN